MHSRTLSVCRVAASATSQQPLRLTRALHWQIPPCAIGCSNCRCSSSKLRPTPSKRSRCDPSQCRHWPASCCCCPKLCSPIDGSGPAWRGCSRACACACALCVQAASDAFSLADLPKDAPKPLVRRERPLAHRSIPPGPNPSRCTLPFSSKRAPVPAYRHATPAGAAHAPAGGDRVADGRVGLVSRRRQRRYVRRTRPCARALHQ